MPTLATVASPIMVAHTRIRTSRIGWFLSKDMFMPPTQPGSSKVLEQLLQQLHEKDTADKRCRQCPRILIVLRAKPHRGCPW